MLTLVLYSLLGLDLARAPSEQITAHTYVTMVRGYQAVVSPALRPFVSCRYSPTCSEYSIAVVERHGMLEGTWLTMARLFRCRSDVPAGTVDTPP